MAFYQAAWDALAGLGISNVIPITYMNSAAVMKAFCGRNAGSSARRPTPAASSTGRPRGARTSSSQTSIWAETRG
jgi:hypothetical protein